MPIFLIGIPLAQKHHLQHKDGPLVDATNYRSIVGAQQCLTLTPPNLTLAVNLVCPFMHRPGVSHFQVMKHILCHLHGTLDYGIHILSRSSLNLYGFFDADWVECPHTRWSTTGYCIYLGANCISWASKINVGCGSYESSLNPQEFLNLQGKRVLESTRK